jgi:hypothetical protein
MREQSPNHSDPIPNAENWILVSDPFERPKVYRHINPIFKTGTGESGVFIFVSDEHGSAPMLMHNIKEIGPKSDLPQQYMSLYTAPNFRLIIGGEPIDIGTVYQIPPSDDSGFVSVTPFEQLNSSIKDTPMLMNIGGQTPYRLKIEKEPHPGYQDGNPKSFRGILDDAGTLAIKQALSLYDYFQGTP